MNLKSARMLLGVIAFPFAVVIDVVTAPISIPLMLYENHRLTGQ